MKKMLFFLLLFPVYSFAQKDKYIELLLKTGDTSLGRHIKLPVIRSWQLPPFFEIGMKSKYGYTVGTDSLFQKIFSSFPADSLPAINFTRQELMAKVYCPQCLATCAHIGRDFQPCHRNACRYTVVWYIRDKAKIETTGEEKF